MDITEIFNQLPSRLKAHKAQNYQGVFHFKFTKDGHIIHQYTVKIDQGSCSVNPGLSDSPKCTVMVDADLYVDIELGKKDAQTALMNQELKIDNLMEMLNFSKLFYPYGYEEKDTQAITSQNSRKPQSGPLVGLRILDFTRLLPGPMATMMLGDMGAEIIKVEAPEFYDYTRDMPPHKGGESIAYLSYGRSKRSLCIDYQSDEGKQVIFDLIKTADILIEQFRPGVMKKMGLDYEAVKAINDQIIYVSITGYGQDGPYASLAGHDLNYITMAGLLSGSTQEEPHIPLVQIADIAGGSYMSMIACLSALHARSQTGKGQFVDVSMMDCAMPLAANPFSWFWMNQKTVHRKEFPLAGGFLNYNIYPTKDGRYIALGTLESKFWNRFCDAIEKPDWKNRMFSTNPEELEAFKAELTALFQTQTGAYWHEWGIKNDLLINLIYNQEEAENDPQIKARQMIVEQEHPTAGKIKSIATPLKFSETPAQAQWVAPSMGEDSKAILEELGITQEQLDVLIQKGIVKG